MTTERPELLIEGSDDGVTWKAVRLPLQAARTRPRAGLRRLLHARLDWQLWFAALSHSLAERLGVDVGTAAAAARRLAAGAGPPGRESVPGSAAAAGAHPHRAVPVQHADERSAGRWWRRGEIEPYSGAWALVNGELRRVR